VVVGVQGRFRNPESLAHGGDGLPEQFLYSVEFLQSDLWEAYRGSPQDKLLVDIYENWLEPWMG
jgi:nitrile hydratase